MREAARYYLVAGEASGDLHGSNLVRALKQKQPASIFCGWGGDAMQAAGVSITKHYRDLAFMGFVEVMRHLRTILRNFKQIKSEIIDFQPDALILIDYPGFNLRLARWARKQGIRVVYYISPQVWAWHASRAQEMSRNIDLLLVILPFERAFFEQYGMKALYVGHPLLDVIERQKANQNRDAILLLLPGSRKQEVLALLPVMLTSLAKFTRYRIVIAGVQTIPKEIYQRLIEQSGLQNRATVEFGNTYHLMQSAEIGIVKSGTSTLEAALHGLPQVVCYRGNWLSYQIARRLVRVKYISLVNLILDEPLVTELIQQDFTAERLTLEIKRLQNPQVQAQIEQGYQRLVHALGERGASARAADAILRFLKSGN